ncbi:hypothetical protein [Streptomyces sp. NPDC002990]
MLTELVQGGTGRVLLGVASDGRLVADRQVQAELAEDDAIQGAGTGAGSSHDRAADVFSLASTLVTACTGRPPFAGTSVPGVLYNVAHSEPDLEAVPPTLRSFIGPCLPKDPAARPTPDNASLP